MIIKFLANNKQYQGTVKTVSEHVVQVNLPQDEEYYEGGFLVLKDDSSKMIGNYSTFIYALNDEGLFSDVQEETEEQPTEPTLRETVDNLTADLSNAQIAITEAYEQNLAITEEVTNLQEAVAEMYELLLTDNGGETV